VYHAFVSLVHFRKMFRNIGELKDVQFSGICRFQVKKSLPVADEGFHLFAGASSTLAIKQNGGFSPFSSNSSISPTAVIRGSSKKSCEA
jgi:hypothetical protein